MSSDRIRTTASRRPAFRTSCRSLRRLVVVALFLLAGCGPPAEERPPLVPAQGTLMINKQPAEGALLVLHPADGKPFDSRGTRPTATVNADGTFQFTTYQSGDGAPVGDYKIALLWLVNPDSSSPWDRLDGRYANPERTDLRVSITEDKPLLDPIWLDDVRVLTQPPRPDPRDLDQVD